MSTGADFGGFLEAAGRSLADAQGTLAGGVADFSAAVAISQAELDVKVAVSRTADGKLAVETLSAEDMRSGTITPGLLSTVRVQYVAVPADTLSAPSQQPTRAPRDVIANVREREDVVALDRILGGLSFEAVFVASGSRWLVTAMDAERRVVREVLVPDEEG